MRSVENRQNAGDYNNGSPLLSSNPEYYWRICLLHGSFVSRSRLQALYPRLIRRLLRRISFNPTQTYIKAHARTPSRQGTIFQLVNDLSNSRNLKNLKRVAPLHFSPATARPSIRPCTSAALCRVISQDGQPPNRSLCGFAPPRWTVPECN
jgi:hypothetical protein